MWPAATVSRRQLRASRTISVLPIESDVSTTDQGDQILTSCTRSQLGWPHVRGVDTAQQGVLQMVVTDEAQDREMTAVRSASTTTDLVRALGQLDSTMIVVGILIGSGIFIVSAESARLVGATGWLLVVLALAGLMTVTGAQCGAELAAMLPRTGGQYVFLREAYGTGPAFLF